MGEIKEAWKTQMTHTSTEQERADFEAVASDNGKWPQAVERDAKGNYLLLTTANGWMWWQAARRAQVVPQGWRLVPVEPTPAMVQAGRDEPLAGESDEDAPEDYKSVYRAMLAAAPQPPEAECMTCSGHGAVGNIENAEPCPECTPRSHLAEAAPVQLPEPAVPYAVFDCHGFYETKATNAAAQLFCDHYNKRDADGGGSAPYTVQALYTEQQVRQILSTLQN